MDKKDQWQQARSKDSCEAGTLVAFSSQVSKGSRRPSFIRILFIRVRLIRETKLRRHIRRLRVPALAANVSWWKVWLGDYCFDGEIVHCSVQRNNDEKCLRAVYNFSLWKGILKKGAIDVLSLPSIYVKTSLHVECTVYSILHFPFYSLNNSLQWLSQRHPTIVELYYFFFLENTFLKQIIEP